MNVVLFDEELTWKNLLPLTFTRPVSEIRVGILTIREKWDLYLASSCGYYTQSYMSKKFSSKNGEALFINSKYCPDAALADAVKNLAPGQALYSHNNLLAFYGTAMDLAGFSPFQRTEFNLPAAEISQPWDIFQKNAEAIKADFQLLTHNRSSQPLSRTVTVIGDRQQVFLEEGAKAEACILNTANGPIYLGKEAEIMEGSVVRGPLALCEHSALKMGTKIYGATTVGPHSKVGGEVNNSVIFGYSNKAHDGFLGNSVIGEWCNLGADTNNSNLKNNYANVKLFNYAQNRQVDTELQFCGLIMGDHSKSGINTMFNTGTVVGVGCNVFGGGFPPTYIPDFSWGGGGYGFVTYRPEKLFETAERVFARRGLTFSDAEKEILDVVFKNTISQRRYNN